MNVDAPLSPDHERREPDQGHDRQPQDVGDCEIRKGRRRFDTQPPSVTDGHRQDNEVRGQGGDNRRDAKQPDKPKIEHADRHAGQQRIKEAKGDTAFHPIHDLHGNRAAQCHCCRYGQVDVARPGSNHQHLADADDHEKDGEIESHGQGCAATLTMSQDNDQPDRQGAQKGPDPRLISEPG